MEGARQEEFAHADFSMHTTLRILTKKLPDDSTTNLGSLQN